MKPERVKLTVYLSPAFSDTIRKRVIEKHGSLNAYVRSLVEADLTRNSDETKTLLERLDRISTAVRYSAIAHDATLDRLGLLDKVQKVWRERTGSNSNAE